MPRISKPFCSSLRLSACFFCINGEGNSCFSLRKSISAWVNLLTDEPVDEFEGEIWLVNNCRNVPPVENTA
jgi:hypothetical protein